MGEAVAMPFEFADCMIHCVAHTGTLGMNNRGREQVDKGWKEIAATMNSHTPN
jgi:hypothetical protein